MMNDIKEGMTVDDVYKYLTSKMTAEEALMTLLSYQIEQYEGLKNMKETEGPINPLYIITLAAFDLGWDIAIENGPEDGNIEGICVGTKAYFERLFHEEKTDITNEGGGPGEQKPRETLQRGAGDTGPHQDEHSVG